MSAHSHWLRTVVPPFNAAPHCSTWDSARVAPCRVTARQGFSYKDMPVVTAARRGEKAIIFSSRASPDARGYGRKVGDKLRDVKLAQTDLSMIPITETKGPKARSGSSASFRRSTRRSVSNKPTISSEKNMGLDRMVELIDQHRHALSQKRFAEEAKISNVTFLSDYRAADFGKAHGLLLKDLHLLSRAVLVVDKEQQGSLSPDHPELAQLPDLEEPFDSARKLVTAS